MILFQNIDVYAPEYLGRKDVLTVYDKIVKIADAGTITADGLLSGAETVDGTGLVLTPGFVDCHVHVLGGGGEGGFANRTPEATMEGLNKFGVTTVVGCLGTDGIGRDMCALVAKTKGLREQGMSAWCYTGSYQGRPISVMGSGMGMPSIGIYSYELYSQYGVENIIRIGSAGSYTDKAKLFDVVLATGAYSESNYAVTQSGDTDDIQTPSAALNEALRRSAAAAGVPLIEGNIHSSDVFYRQPSDAKPTYWERLRDEKGCLAVEMESFALFHNAKVLGKRAACLLTISDSFVSPEITTAEQRQTSFTAMMQVALGVDAFLEE